MNEPRQVEVKTIMCDRPLTPEQYIAYREQGWVLTHMINWWTDKGEPRIVVYLEKAGLIVGGKLQ